jgi:hypothetical protein
MLGTGIGVAITAILLVRIGGLVRRQVGTPRNRQVSAPSV